MKKLIIILWLAFAGAAHAEWSLTEMSIIKKLPDTYKKHDQGIISNPSDEDVQMAIDLGTEDKEGKRVQYAYLFADKIHLFDSGSTYVSVTTPLALIAHHAREQAREYRKPDTNYVAYVRGLKLVQLELSRLYISAETFNAYSFKKNMILLRDGERVEPFAGDIIAYQHKNPFETRQDKMIKKAVTPAAESALRTMKAYLSSMSQEQRRTVAAQYISMGLAKEHVYEVLEIKEDVADDAPSKTYISDDMGVFKLEDLTKPGKYEIVFRTPGSNNLLDSGGKEKRFPITFKTFR